MSNITPRIRSLIGRNQHNRNRHPLCLVKEKIFNYFGSDYDTFDSINPVVTIEDNFDKLLIAKTHPSRRETEAFYEDEFNMLRTHTTAHQNFLLNQGLNKFLVAGDVYRKDHVDRWHQPVFHQLEGVCMGTGENMLEHMDGLVHKLFPKHDYRRVDSHYPFTEPSYEYEIKCDDVWIEIMGCGIVQPRIMESCGRTDTGWAFGMGLERLAMLMFNINDIRWFWNEDESFLSTFRKEEPEWVPCERPCYRHDIFMTVNQGFCHSELCMFCWEQAGHLLEEVKMLAQNSGLTNSRKYRLKYSAVDRMLTQEEVNDIHNKVLSGMGKALDVEIKE